MMEISTNGTNKLAIDCPACQQRFSLEMPKPVVVNLPKVSTVIATHEKLVKCPKCGQSFFWLIEQSQNKWAVQPVSEEERRQIEGTNIIELGTGRN